MPMDSAGDLPISSGKASHETCRDVKRGMAGKIDPFNPKIYRIRVAIFLVQKNSDFF